MITREGIPNRIAVGIPDDPPGLITEEKIQDES